MSSLSSLDSGLYALFSRHADSERHDKERAYHRGASLGSDFDRYIARVYGLSWVVAVLMTCVMTFFAHFLTASVFVAVGGGLVCGFIGKRTVVIGSRGYLRMATAARREKIERTLPGAVRYLRTLSAGTDDQRTLLRKVTEQEAYGETAVSFRRVLNRAALTGSLDQALRSVARDTPSQDLLAPFLIKFNEHARQGGDALSGYLRLESRMLSHRQSRARQRASDFLELIAEMFVVLLVLPALLVIVLTVMAVLSPGLSQTYATPLGSVTLQSVLVYASAVFILWVGIGTSWLVGSLRPPGMATPSYERPVGYLATFESALINPTSAMVLLAPAALLVAGISVVVGFDPVTVVLMGYVAFCLPIGLVAVRRARIDDEKDHELRDFVHSVAGHVGLGRPFSESVARVARDVDLDALGTDVDHLAYNLGLMSAPDEAADVRAAALYRFVERVGTPLAAQSIGLITGALDVGSDAESVFETLQAEVGRLYHEKRELRSTMTVYVAVGWTTALLIVGIMIAVNSYVLDSFSQLTAVTRTGTGTMAINPSAIQPERDRYGFYVVTQATMLASGWFAGTASRGRYEALLHSALLVGLTIVVFVGIGMI